MDGDSLEASTRAEMTPPDLRAALDRVLHESLQPYAAGLGTLYVVFAVSHAFVQPLVVADSGPGITPEEIPVLFEKYRRAERARSQVGTGLGLFVVKTIVEAHGGRVEVQSTLGNSACFSVFLPVASLSAPPAL